MEDTPLGQIVLIRKENDKERIDRFSEYERKIYREWRSFRSEQQRKTMTQKDMDDVIIQFQSMFKNMFKGGV